MKSKLRNTQILVWAIVNGQCIDEFSGYCVDMMGAIWRHINM